MDKFITNLLENNNRVVVPDFGAFIIKQKKPLKIVFNEFLRYNDGLLIDYISKTENIEKEESLKRINQYVQNARKKLNAGEQVAIFGLGKLFKDEVGKIDFIQGGEISEKQTTKETTPPPKEEAPEKKREEKPADDMKDSKNITQKKEETGIPGKKEEKKTEDKKPDSVEKEKKEEKPSPEVEKKPEPQQKTKEKPPEANKQAERKYTPPAPSARRQTSVTTTGPEQKRYTSTTSKQGSNKSLTKYILWISVIVLVLFIGVLAFLINDTTGYFPSRESVDNQEQTTDPKTDDQVESERTAESEKEGETGAAGQQPSVEESIATEEQPPSKVEQQPPKEQKTSVTSSTKSGGKRYYIVAGGFRNEKNAERYVQKLIREGYPAEEFAVINGLHFVSFNSFINKDEAVRELKDIQREYEPKAWLKRY